MILGLRKIPAVSEIKAHVPLGLRLRRDKSHFAGRVIGLLGTQPRLIPLANLQKKLRPTVFILRYFQFTDMLPQPSKQIPCLFIGSDGLFDVSSDGINLSQSCPRAVLAQDIPLLFAQPQAPLKILASLIPLSLDKLDFPGEAFRLNAHRNRRPGIAPQQVSIFLDSL